MPDRNTHYTNTNHNMNHLRNILYASALLTPAASSFAGEKPAGNDTRPNVILIVADDLGYGDLGCYGAQDVKTPNVDRLAKNGIRFLNSHAAAATSTPSRYALLTGHYVWRRPDTRIAEGNARMIIRPEQYTMADMFRQAGYTTAAIGKWHLGLGDKTAGQDWNAPLPCGLQDIGFDYHYIMAATGDRVPCVFIENGFIADYDPTAPIEVSYRQNFAGEPTGKSNPEMLYNLKPSPNHGHDQSIVNGISRIGFMKGGGKALWKDENIADSITSHAVEFIRKNHREPFFMYLCTNDIHVPRFPHPRFRGKTDMGHRGDAIVQFDWTVGEVMKTLKDLKIDKNTIIILTSDNGPVVDDGYADEAVARLGNHKPAGPLRGNKYSSFEGGTRVPFIVSWPKGMEKGCDSRALVSQIDLFASFAQMLDARLPEGSCPDSRRHWDAITGKDAQGCEYVIEQNLWNVLSVRTSDWKYIEPSNGAPYMKLTDIETGNSPLPQLYDMSKEGEQENLAKEHPEVTERMAKIIDNERKGGNGER